VTRSWQVEALKLGSSAPASHSMARPLPGMTSSPTAPLTAWQWCEIETPASVDNHTLTSAGKPSTVSRS